MKTVLILTLMLTGCATCREHPLACSIGAAVIAGSVAATIAANDHHRDRREYPCQKIDGVCVSPQAFVNRPICSAGAC